MGRRVVLLSAQDTARPALILRGRLGGRRCWGGRILEPSSPLLQLEIIDPELRNPKPRRVPGTRMSEPETREDAAGAWEVYTLLPHTRSPEPTTKNPKPFPPLSLCPAHPTPRKPKNEKKNRKETRDPESWSRNQAAAGEKAAEQADEKQEEGQGEEEQSNRWSFDPFSWRLPRVAAPIPETQRDRVLH